MWTRNLGKTLVIQLFSLLVLLAGSLQAFDTPDRSGLGQSEFRAAILDVQNEYRLAANLPSQDAAKALADLNALGVAPEAGRVDVRGGRWAVLQPTAALLPGTGLGNDLTWADLGIEAPASATEFSFAASKALGQYLLANSHLLRIELDELAQPGRVTVQRGGTLVQFNLQRVFDGVPVRGSYLTATISHGNLILLGTEMWGDIAVSADPQITESQALAAVKAYVAPYQTDKSWNRAELVLVPVAKGDNLSQVAVGGGLDYRLAWMIRPAFAGDARRFEALVDAHSGEMLSFEDTNRYADVRGGVFPVSNDGVSPDGVEQPGWPMPYQDVSTTGGTLTTDTGGNITASGPMTATFYGPYIDINDTCGAASLSQSDGIDWGTSGGTDCVTPGYGGAGNTHSSRTGFYELNKIIEMGRGQLPANGWLQNRLISNMNIVNTCNAFWDGTVNFFRSGGGCANTGEIAAVFDHEWGHGMDANDANPGIASPSGEGIADIYSALRLNDSCIGRGFYMGGNCGGNGDPCLACDGVRDIDYLMRASGNPHDYSWSNANCGGSVHCVGGVYSEAVWSLWKRELQSPPYGYDNNTAQEIVTRLTYLGGGNVGTWFSGGPPNGGCAATSGYMNFLAADDDNGNLNDGTPHMTAIYNAFNDQEIACGTPTVQDAGCGGTPAVAPVVSTGNGNQLVTLSWTAVPGATEYEVFRTEGVFACDFGKTLIATTTGTNLNDSGLQNGREYSYVVIPKGPADSCFGPASACASEAPVGQPDFAISCSPATPVIEQGTNAVSTCSALSSFGYTGTIDLSCAGNPAGIGCSFSPTSVSPPADGSDSATLTLAVDLAQAVGPFTFNVVGDDGSTTRSQSVTVTVRPAGQNGPQSAVYNASLGAPECSIPGSECSAGALLNSRDTLGTPEPNQPNTLDACADGGAGTYHSDESNDGLVVRTLDGYDFAEGATVEVEATVWAWSTGSSDTLDLFYAADANSPTWIRIGSIVPPAGGAQTMSAQYVLPAGALQAVRAQFRYTSTNAPCSAGAYNDRDDLVFAVNGPAGSCTVDADCDDGAFCNGAEVCNAGVCEAGTPVVCDDGLYCNGTDTCNETTDSCDAGTPVVCDDGLFCNGTETCNEGTDSCDAGTAVVCADDGAFCNGPESCDEDADACASGPEPCSAGQTCDEGGDVCVSSVCDNDGICESGEDCDTCPGDCAGGTTGAVCGNHICEMADGETGENCPSDCNAKLSGKPGNRFSCGESGPYATSCSSPLCSTNGWQCTDTPVPGVDFCCGDGVCTDGGEDGSSCELDCGAPPAPECGNNTVEFGEMCDGTDLAGENCQSQGFTNGMLSCDSSSECTAFDTSQCCLATVSKEKGPRCSDGVDNDCDGYVDADDPDCG